MRAVNLLPRDVERERSGASRLPLFLAAGGFAAVTAGSVLLFVSASGSISDQRARLDSLESTLARTPRTGQPAVAADVIAQERTDRVAALAAAMTTRLPLDRLLRELALVLPDDAWLTGLTATAPESTAAPAGTPPATQTSTTQEVTIQGATYSQASVARVLARLAAVPSLDRVRLSASARVQPTPEADGSKAKPKGKVVVTFTITANLRTGTTT